MGRLADIFDILKTAVQDYLDDKASRLGAALAYYGLFSLAPMALIAVLVAGVVLGGESAARKELTTQAADWLGQTAADEIDSLIAGISTPQSVTAGALVSIGALLFAATGLFANLQGALNYIWEVEPEGGGVTGFLEKRLFSFLMVLLLGALLILSFFSTSFVQVLAGYFSDVLPVTGLFVQAGNVVVSLVLLTLLFAIVYKVLPDVKISWGDVWIGAGITAVLFILGMYLISLYFTYGSPGGPARAAGTVIVLVIWIYYSAQIVLFGAELTQVVVNRYGSGIVPEEGARYRPGAKRAYQRQGGGGTQSVGVEGPVTPELVGSGANTIVRSPGDRAEVHPGIGRPQEQVPSRPSYVLEAPAAIAAWAMAGVGLLLGVVATATGFVLRRKL